ncbi:MAG: hypothetical protein WCT85_07015 [Parachlamydiales bacterium]|jgi:hypothetical protein
MSAISNNLTPASTSAKFFNPKPKRSSPKPSSFSQPCSYQDDEINLQFRRIQSFEKRSPSPLSGELLKDQTASSSRLASPLNSSVPLTPPQTPKIQANIERIYKKLVISIDSYSDSKYQMLSDYIDGKNVRAKPEEIKEFEEIIRLSKIYSFAKSSLPSSTSKN